MTNRFKYIQTALNIVAGLIFLAICQTTNAKTKFTYTTHNSPATSTAPSTIDSAQQVNIAFIGNSITYGATLPDPTTQCPPRRVQEILQSHGLTVDYINCAVSGYTTFHFLPSGTRHTYVVDAIKKLSKNPGKLFVLIMLGTNDSAESGTLGAPVSTTTYYNNMKTIVDDIFAYNEEANVILNYPIWYSPNTHNGATYLQGGLNRLKSYHPVIDSLANYYQTQTAHHVYAGNKEAYSFFEDNTAYLTAEGGYSGTFYLHPNAEGAKRLASFWAGSILQILSNTPTTDNSKKGYAPLNSATLPPLSGSLGVKNKK